MQAPVLQGTLMPAAAGAKCGLLMLSSMLPQCAWRAASAHQGVTSMDGPCSHGLCAARSAPKADGMPSNMLSKVSSFGICPGPQLPCAVFVRVKHRKCRSGAEACPSDST